MLARVLLHASNVSWRSGDVRDPLIVRSPIFAYVQKRRAIAHCLAIDSLLTRMKQSFWIRPTTIIIMPRSASPLVPKQARYYCLKSIEEQKSLEDLIVNQDERLRILGASKSKERRAVTNFRNNKLKARASRPETYVKSCIAHSVPIREGDTYLKPIEQKIMGGKEDPDYSEDQSLLNKMLKNNGAKPDKTVSAPAAPKRTTRAATSSKTSTSSMSNNKLGKQIVLKMPGGIIFVILWIDAKLNQKTLKFMVSDDGMSLLQQKKHPLPKSASKLLSVYKWGNRKKHTTVETLQDELDRLSAGLNKEDMWEETVVLNFQEAMLPQFYNDRGQPLGTIQYDVDSAGRQFILFHLKTVAAHKKAPEAGIFSNNSRSLKKNRNSMDVDTDDEDDDDDDTDDEQEDEEEDEQEQDDEEYFSPRNDSKRPSGFDDDKLKNFAHHMLAEVQEMMLQSQTNQRAETEQLIQQYTGQQMFAQGSPVPDGHPSS